jgi:hypothetical protein
MKRPTSLEPTRYELAMERDNQKFLVCYSARMGRHAILQSLRNRAPEVLQVGQITDDDMLTWKKPASQGAMLGNWRVYWTGRTQRQAISEGELPFVVTAAKEATVN